MGNEIPNVGDRVVLKSSGPIMTVGTDLKNGSFICQWFHDGKLETGIFEGVALRPATDNDVSRSQPRINF